MSHLELSDQIVQFVYLAQFLAVACLEKTVLLVKLGGTCSSQGLHPVAELKDEPRDKSNDSTNTCSNHPVDPLVEGLTTG